MIKGTYDYLKNLASRNVCLEHGTPLEVAWYGPEETYALRCGHGHYPDAIIRSMSLTEEFKADQAVPGYIEDNIKKRQRRKAMEQGKQPDKVRGWLVPTTDLVTGEVLPPAVIEVLINYARKYRLDPERGHVVVMYSKPYITLDGYLYHANRSGIPYTLMSWPLDENAKKDFMINPEDYAWRAVVRFTGTEQAFTGLGIVTHDEMIATSEKKPGKLRAPVVAAHPWQLAQKRAEWQAMKRAFPIGETKEATDAMP